MRTALIAGEGILPVEIAKKLCESETPPLILALRKDKDVKILKPFAGKLVRLRTPSLSKGIKEMKAWRTEELIMAGRIPKRVIYFLPFIIIDPLTRSVLKKSLRDDHSLLGSIVKAFENEGIKVVPYWQILPEFIALSGNLTSRAPSEKEMLDINYGREILKVTLPCSFGQAIAVAEGAVLAVEAMEGTDAMIKRAGELARHGVVVKMMRTDQDPRYDLPTVGPKTLESMHEGGLTCLAVESQRTLILEPEKFFALAEKYNIAVWGL